METRLNIAATKNVHKKRKKKIPRSKYIKNLFIAIRWVKKKKIIDIHMERGHVMEAYGNFYCLSTMRCEVPKITSSHILCFEVQFVLLFCNYSRPCKVKVWEICSAVMDVKIFENL